jgi:nitrogen fixation/metabolism regulation signal transduction histidine kinase
MIGELGDQAEKLRQAERISAWREIARRVAHQIKNPLTPIQLSVHRLRALEPETGSREEKLLEECLDAVTGEVQNLRRIADEFSRFARLPEPSPQRTALGSLIREVTELYHAGHPEIRLQLEVEPDLPPALVDPDLTRQALSNLVKNAVEAMPEGGELTVRAGRWAKDGGEDSSKDRGSRGGAASPNGPVSFGGEGAPEDAGSSGESGFPACERIRISITDTGGGLPPEVQERLFTPYLTTKRGGTGLGLALAHRMVVDQGGTLEVLTEEGHGTTFIIDFPAELMEV